MPWNIENYSIIDRRVLKVDFTLPLIEFIYITIDDVKEAWLEMLKQFMKEQPGFDVSWEMQPYQDQALVTIQIAKAGHLSDFTKEEARGAMDAVDALFEKKKKKK